MTGGSIVPASIYPGGRIGGRYAVEEAVGKGGMGTVYRVHDESTGRKVALKLLQKGVAEGAPVSALFQREYQTLAQLAHPRVIQVLDYDVHEGRPYYTMELLDGRDLRELAPMPWRKACAVLRDVASGLALLHSRRLLHRDLSPRNVRLTRDGRAKLIDFGAMAPMGIVKHVAGTPPYMAPEAVYGQALDARTDLFSLGALAYWTLSGHEAYPARRTSQLAMLWGRPLLRPSRYGQEIPRALEDLVLSLLSLDLRARPAQAAEVIDRLTAVADLAPVERLEVARSYLSTPVLVGHGATLARFHKRLVRGVRGRGSAVFVQADSGMGRTRLLQTFVLEAKLSGVLSVWVDAEDAQLGELGVLRAIMYRVFEALPELALATFEPHADRLGHALPELYERLPAPPPLMALDRTSTRIDEITEAARSWLLEISHKRPLMIALDDADHCDADSLIALALLAAETRAHKVVVAITAGTEVDAVRGRALSVFRDNATRLPLRPLADKHVAVLLESVFGRVENLAAVVEWAQGLAQGRPRTVMELAHSLVQRGIARYEGGSWSLPVSLDGQALPGNVEQALTGRLAAVSAEARELAQALALVSEDAPLDLEEYALLAGDDSSGATYQALQELIEAQVLDGTGEGYHFRQRALIEHLLGSMDDEARRAMHRRLASIYARRLGWQEGGLLLARAQHLYAAGDLDGCIDALRQSQVRWLSARFANTSGVVAMLEECLAHAEGTRPPEEVHRLRRLLVQLASTTDPALVRHGRAVLSQLREDCGLSHWAEVGEHLDLRERMEACLKLAQERYDTTHPQKRGLAPQEAVRELVGCAMQLHGAHAALGDAQAMAGLYSLLEPLESLGPAVPVLREMMDVTYRELQGHSVLRDRLKVIARVSEPIPGLDHASRQISRMFSSFWVGIELAMLGQREALERADEVEAHPLYAPLAWQIRTVAHLFRGDEREAERCRERRILLGLRSPLTSVATLRGLSAEAAGFFACDSLLGLKRARDEVRQRSRGLPGPRRGIHLVDGLYQLLRGEPRRALADFERAESAEYQIHALLGLGEVGRASGMARELIEHYESRVHNPVRLWHLRALLLEADLAAGDARGVAASAPRLIAAAEEQGVDGILLGVLHEMAGRAALELEDTAALETALRGIAPSYGRSSGLRSRQTRLLAEARANLVEVDPELQGGPYVALMAQIAEARTQLSRAAKPEQRLAHALKLLADEVGARRGYLFGMQREGLRLAASLDASRPPDGLEDMIALFLNAELESGEVVSRTLTGTFDEAPEATAWINDGRDLYYPVVLSCVLRNHRVVGGVAVLALADQREPEIGHELVQEVSEALIEAGDVIGARAAD